MYRRASWAQKVVAAAVMMMYFALLLSEADWRLASLLSSFSLSSIITPQADFLFMDSLMMVQSRVNTMRGQRSVSRHTLLVQAATVLAALPPLVVMTA
jgi:uncharacterized membrane protein YciS (DUF1049 family)